jgi:ABC transporter substrate binding protein
MDRRAFITVVGGSILASPLAGQAQQVGKAFRIGVLGVGEPQLLRQSLRDAGYVEGQNLTIEWRNPEGKPERFVDLAAELVRLKVDVLVAPNPAATIAAKKATASIPIVMLNTPDPVQLGLVASLGRPGGNITGTTSLSADLSAKQLELPRRRSLTPRASPSCGIRSIRGIRLHVRPPRVPRERWRCSFTASRHERPSSWRRPSPR